MTTPSSATFRFPTATAIACCASSKTPAGSPPESIMMGRWPADVAVGKELRRSQRSVSSLPAPPMETRSSSRLPRVSILLC